MNNLFGGCDNSLWFLIVILCCCGGNGFSNCICDILPLLLILQCCCGCGNNSIAGNNPASGFGSCR